RGEPCCQQHIHSTSYDYILITALPAFASSGFAIRLAGERRLDIDRFRKVLANLVPPMLEQAERVAEHDAGQIRADSLREARETLGHEQQRLSALKAINPAVLDVDIQSVADELASLERELPQARLRLDAVRFVASPA